jgi:Flp pilus assembly protein CpaB
VQQSLTGRLMGSRGNKLLSTRGGNIAVAVAAAALAAILLIVYLNGYRTSLKSATAPTPVLVANRLIAKGTPASVLGSQGAFQLATVPEEHVKTGAVADPELIAGRVAVRDLLPGQQLTVADFSTTTTNAVPTRITGSERALSISVDAQHGMIGQVASGNYVDVYVSLERNGIPAVSLVKANVQVLETPAGGSGGVGSGNTSNYVFKVSSSDAGRFAYAAENGQIWIVARPAANAVPTRPSVVTAQQLLAGQRGG